MGIQVISPRSVLLSISVIALLLGGCKKEDKDIAEPEKTGLIYKGTTSPLAEGRMLMGLLQEGNFTCFVGGGLLPFGSNAPSGNIDVYNAQKNNWTTYSTTGVRTDMAAALVANKLVVAGGGSATPRDMEMIDIIDLVTGQQTTAKLSTPKYGLAAAGIGTKVVIAGGFSYTNGGAKDEVEILDVETKTIKMETARLRRARTGLVAGAAGNRIVFAGGTSGLSGSAYYNDVDIYNVQTGKWDTARLVQGRSEIKVLVVGPRIFFIGGVNGVSMNGARTYSDYIDIYNASTNQWSNIRVPQNNISMDVCTNGSKIFITSGSNSSYPFVERLTIYDIEAGQLRTIPVPEGRILTALATVGDKLIMAGGTLPDFKTFSDKVTVYDLKTDAFDVTTHTLPNRLAGAVAATVGNKLFVVSGFYYTLIPQEVMLHKTVSEFVWK